MSAVIKIRGPEVSNTAFDLYCAKFSIIFAAMTSYTTRKLVRARP